MTLKNLRQSFLCILFWFHQLAFGSICEDDNRKQASISGVGYSVSSKHLEQYGLCTVTLFSQNCGISAGHCLHNLEMAVFQGSGTIEENTYSIDKNSIRALSSRIGNNWAVFRMNKNAITGLSAGNRYGYFELETNPLAAVPETLWTVAENGSRDLDNFPGPGQLWSEGKTLWISDSAIYHKVDTGSGSGGAVLFDPETSKGYAIHTHGGCDIMGNNKGTIIGKVPFLIKAIQECKALDQ